MPKPKVAIVYDWLTTEFGGAEQVLQILCEMYPDAPLFTSVWDRRLAWTNNKSVVTSFLQLLPKSHKYYRYLVPLFPVAFESLSLAGYDVIISVTSAFAKSIQTSPSQLHVCYLLTPTRFLYSHADAYSKDIGVIKHPIIWNLLKPLWGYLRLVDFAAAYRPDVLIPISQVVANRITKYYGRTAAQPLYPPVNIETGGASDVSTANQTHTIQYLVVSRLLSYKKIDQVIMAAKQAKRLVVIVGSGPEDQRLKNLLVSLGAADWVRMVGSVSRAELLQYYHESTALILPNDEDFGLVALEANACGKPAIIHKQSGAAEVITHKVHGIHAADATAQSIIEAMQACEATSFSSQLLRTNARKYGKTSFVRQFHSDIDQAWEDHQKGIYGNK